ncbi:MAG TPA: Ku protein [Candidatus Synoicihabitans sp.]|nr:Ku protein [Candidatus Synoicihabitans sp.]
MRAIWKGAVNFGLVSIPVSLFPATRREELKFRLLRKDDLSPINYKRVAEVDGKTVAWEDIVKGYEYEKGKFVVLTEDDFKRVDIEATQTVDILDFVKLEDVDPMMFQKPYYLEPLKSGLPAYRLLRDVLKDTGKIGIAKVVIKTRQHLAALKPHRSLLVLELMHFQDELVDARELKVPAESQAKTGQRELQMARLLVDELSREWDPARYTDDYESQLLKLIDQKVKRGGKDLPAPAKAARPASNVIDLVSILRQSLEEAGGSASGAAKATRPARGKKAAAKKRASRGRKKAA